MIVKPNLITHLPAKFSIPFPRDPGGYRAGSHPSWLKDDYSLLPGHAGVQEHLGDLSGLARTSGRDQNEAIAGFQSADDVRMNLPNGREVCMTRPNPNCFRILRLY